MCYTLCMMFTSVIHLFWQHKLFLWCTCVCLCVLTYSHTYYMFMLSVFKCFIADMQYPQFPVQEADGVDCFGICTHTHNKTITSLHGWESWLLNYILLYMISLYSVPSHNTHTVCCSHKKTVNPPQLVWREILMRFVKSYINTHAQLQWVGAVQWCITTSCVLEIKQTFRIA